MTSYILRRILLALPVLLGVSLVTFFMVRLVPGDTVTAMLGQNYSEAEAAELRRSAGLDQPLVAQYGIWVSQAVRGDLGQSFRQDRSVISIIADRLPVTLQLTGMALLFAMLVGVPLGMYAALRRGRAGDYATSATGLIGISIPGFWLASLLILLFSIHLRWLPSGTFVPITDDPVANLQHMILPAIALGTAVAAVVMRMTRSAMLEVIRQDFVRTARAKGLGRRDVLRHMLRNALPPILTILGLQAGYLLGGSVVIEEVFSLPGLGRLALQAVGDRDYVLLQGVVLLIAVGFVLVNLLVDVLYGVLDPRISVGAPAGGKG